MSTEPATQTRLSEQECTRDKIRTQAPNAPTALYHSEPEAPKCTHVEDQMHHVMGNKSKACIINGVRIQNGFMHKDLNLSIL